MSTPTPTVSTLTKRQAGVLLHPTSLPAEEGLGDLGLEAFRFVDFLQAAGMGVWQVLPVGPTHEDLSPYMSLSVHAGNPNLISLQRLREWGWLEEGEAAGQDRQQQLHAARLGFETRADEAERQDLRDFVSNHESWLEDYALYQVLRERHQGAHWDDWPASLRDREPQALAEVAAQDAERLAQVRFEQYVFFRQWADIKRYANARGVQLFGDMPIFVAHDSAEVWARRELFDLDDRGRPRTVAGVPPDYFSETGQLWGNPHYRWDRMARNGYRWWLERLHTAQDLYDRLRIDHFRGFEAYWQIDAGAETAMGGHWVQGPGDDFFRAVTRALPDLPLVAEDLGIITPEVEALRDRWGLPGMKILQFAFDGSADNPYLPENQSPNAVVYTGTHDNDTSLGWFTALPHKAQAQVRDYLRTYLGSDEAMPWALVCCALAAPANLAIIPMQDLLELGSAARMNTPSVTEGNWRWGFDWSQLPADLAPRLCHWLQYYGRCN
jgi:4-alpha-glucanotransferase